MTSVYRLYVFLKEDMVPLVFQNTESKILNIIAQYENYDGQSNLYSMKMEYLGQVG